MAVRASEKIRARIAVGAEEVVFVFPGWADPVVQAALDQLLDTRQVVKGRQVTDNTKKARTQFFDATCVAVENFEDRDAQGQYLPCTPANFADWKERIPTSWKTSVVAQVFEERAVLTEEDQGE